MRHGIAVAVVAASLCGCAFSAVNRPNPDRYAGWYRPSNSFPVTIAAGVEASKNAIEAMGWETLTANPAIGLVRSKPRTVVIPANCDCGTWNSNNVSGTANAELVINLESEPKGTTLVKVSVQCVKDFTGQNLYGATTRRETYTCASRGRIEDDFWAMLNRVLAAGKTKP